MNATMENTSTKKTVVCKHAELGIVEGREYTQLRRYEAYKGFWIRVVMVDGRECNFEDKCFEDK